MRNSNTNIQIEKLRAIAVLFVLLFHAGMPYMHKGYLGVDVFFVISGYLMTSHIFHSLEKGDFNFLEYCEKRVRRIMPTFLAVAVITIPPALIILMPDHLENYGQSLVASTLYANNLLLYLTTSYWDSHSELKPLLQTWSLGVEIQFYLIYPLILCIIFHNYFVNKKIIIILLFGISMLPIFFWEIYSAEAIFYLLPFRLFEFLIGGLIAVQTNEKERFTYINSYIGLFFIFLAILYAGVFINERIDSFCRLALVLVGACIVINSKPFESHKLKWISSILVYLGSISYSLYLLHQPIFAFIRASSPADVSYIVLLATIPGIIFISSLTFKYIEEPFRSKAIVPAKKLFFFIIAISLFLISIGLYLHISKGMPSRFKYGDNINSFQDSITYNERVRAYANYDSNQEKNFNILIVGDSFARDFANVLTDGGGIQPSKVIYSSINLDICENVPVIFELISRYKIKFVYIAYQKYKYECNQLIDDYADKINFKNILIIGPKSFGRNINFLSLIPKEEWVLQMVEIDKEALNYDAHLRRRVINFKYISLIDLMKMQGNNTKITNNKGDLISIDGEHLTKPGAIYMACLLEMGGYSSLIHKDFKPENRSCIQ